MKRLLICFVFFTLGVSAAEAQNNQQKEAQAFILKVVSEYKNPLAYYPFNRELFLPTQAEVDSIENAISKIKPEEIYNFADQDHVRWSFEIPWYSFDVTAGAVVKILEIIKNCSPQSKFFQPFTSNMFGNSIKKKQNQ